MKKTFRFVAIATLVLAAAGTITFVACNKKSEVINNLPQAQSIQYSEMDKAMIDLFHLSILDEKSSSNILLCYFCTY